MKEHAEQLLRASLAAPGSMWSKAAAEGLALSSLSPSGWQSDEFCQGGQSPASQVQGQWLGTVFWERTPLGLVWEDRVLSCAVSDSPGYLHHVGLVFLDVAEQRFHGPPSSNNILCKKQKVHQSNLHSTLLFTFAELFLINKMHIHFKCQPIGVHTESRISYAFVGISFGDCAGEYSSCILQLC